MAAPKLTITKAEVIDQVGPVITTEEGQRALVMSRPSTLAHGFVFVAPAAAEWDENFWLQFHVDLSGEPFNMETGFGGKDYWPATREPTVLEIAREWDRVMRENPGIPPPQQIDLDPVRIKSG